MIIKQKIGASANFRKAKFPLNEKIIGKYSYLEPIKICKHAKDLFNNFSLEKTNTLWTYMPYGPFKNLPIFKNYLKKNVLVRIHFFMPFTQKDLNRFVE